MRPSRVGRWVEAVARALIGATAVAAAWVALAGPEAFAPAPAAAAGRFRAAMVAYDAQQWPQAWERLAAAADAGDARAARVATLMARQGASLFGRPFDASRDQLVRWNLAAQGRSARWRHEADAAAAVAAGAGRPGMSGAPGPAVVTSLETDGRTGGSPPAVQVARAR